MKKKRVLVVIAKYFPDYTGAGIRISRLFGRLKLDFDVLTLRTQARYFERNFIGKPLVFSFRNLHIRGSKVLILRVIFWFYIFSGVFFFLRFHESEYYLIHSVGSEWISIFSCLLGKIIYRIPYIVEVTSFSVDDPQTLIKKGFKRLLFGWIRELYIKLANYVIVSSPAAYKSSLNINLKPQKIVLRPNPIDTNIFKSVSKNNKEKIRKELGLPINKKILITVGRICEQKNQKFIVEMFKDINLDAFLLIIGPLSKKDSEYYTKLLKEVSMNKKRVKIVPQMVTNVQEYLKASDLFVFASKVEGFPNVLAESLCSGKPVVSTLISGISDWIIFDERLGTIVEKLDSKKFAVEVESWLNKKNINEKEIAHLAEKHFSNVIIDKTYLRIIKYFEN